MIDERSSVWAQQSVRSLGLSISRKENKMGIKYVSDMGHYTYDDDIYADNLKRSQKELAAEVLDRLDGVLAEIGRTKTYFVKMRKEYLAAIVSEWHTATRADEMSRTPIEWEYKNYTKPIRIKPEGTIRSLYPKPKRVRQTRDNGGQSRKSRREYTKNNHRKARGLKRLMLAQAA
jgi:hypothetical protein